MSKIGYFRLPPQGVSPTSWQWFYRRPFFWWALAAVCAVHVAAASAVAPWGWIAFALLGAGVAFTLSREAGTILTVAGLFAAAAAAESRPLFSAHWREGAPVTLLAVVREPGPGGAVLEAGERLTPTGRQPDRMTFGLLAVEMPLARGDRVEVSGLLRRPLPATNPGGFDYRTRWLQRGVHWIVNPRPAGVRLVGHEPLPWWRRAAAQVRATVLHRNRETLTPAGAFIANSFLLGEEESPEAELSQRISEAFRDSGTIHLLVVSGTQVSLVMGAFIWLGWRLWRFRYLCWTLGALAVAVFWLLTDGSASVSRAAVMGAVLVLALALNREPDGENCLGIAALLLLAFNRFAVFDVGAQLSFAAVWGLIRVAPALYRALGPRPELAGGLRPAHAAVAGVVAFSVAAHLATAPVLAFHFQRVSWSGILANLPMAVLTLCFTYAALAHGLLAGVGMHWLAGAVDYGAASFTGWAGFFAEAPFGARDAFPFPLWLAPFYYVALLLPGRSSGRRLATLAVPAGLCAVLFLTERLPAAPPRAPTLRAIDVGQGDALLLQGTSGESILVDAGRAEPERRVSTLVRALRGLRIASLDALIVTHADSDHIGGLPQLLGRIPVKLLLQRVDPEPNEADLWARIQARARARGIPSAAPEPGDRIRVGGSSLLFLGPPEATQGNEASLVCRWDAGGARFLLTGDAGFASERSLLRWGDDLRADVLKVGHHGSAGSTAFEFLQAVRPGLAVISCGRDNPFGHPAPEVLERLAGAGIVTARTDRTGMQTVTVDGGRIRAQSHLRVRE